VNIFLTVLASVLLVGFAGFMAASEAALGVLSTDDLRDQSRDTKARRSLLAIANDPNPHRNVTTFVRIVAETAAAVIVTVALVASSLPLWGALVIAILIMTAASFVLAGSSPRSVGRAHPFAVLKVAAPIIHFLRVVLGPLSDALVSVGDRVTPGRPGTSGFASEEQLLSMVDEAVKNDVLEKDERELIHSIFEFGDTVVREVMVPRIDMVVLEAESNLQDATSLFHSSGYSRIPIVGESVDDIVGILYLRDVSRRGFEKPKDLVRLTVRDLARPAVFIPESKKADDTLRQMQAESNHLAMVVDEHGGIAGLVTLEDLIEELVGEIADEYDRGAPEVEDLGEQHFVVSARLRVEELGDLFGLELEDDDVETVGGLLEKHLERIAVVGDVVGVSGLILEAYRSEARRKRVTRVRVHRDEALIEAQDAFVSEENE
jgi:CBS domain containing-hemolysin-like protein